MNGDTLGSAVRLLLSFGNGVSKNKVGLGSMIVDGISDGSILESGEIVETSVGLAAVGDAEND